MKFSIILPLVLLAGCTSGPQIVQNSNNTASQPQRAEQLQDSRAHTTENQPPVQSTGGKWTQSGDPIDTKEFDAKIAAAEKELVRAKGVSSLRKDNGEPAESMARKALAEAYFERGVALTEARQYASALGDYRRVLKQDPDHAEAKKWIDQIIGIYAMLKKEYPKEGEEPPPLPFKKSA